NSTAGEEVLLNPRGGAVALYSTVRAVYASENASLTRLALLELFGEGPDATIGDAMRNAKNQLSGGTLVNSRKFALIGDPSMQLAIPRYSVQTSTINGRPAQNNLDTLRALQKVVVEGVVLDEQGNLLNDFNGVVYPTVFDKPFRAATLGQDPGSPKGYQFEVQKNVIFKGRASVRNGRFTFTFVVPKDINYAFGLGKISYYAADTLRMSDATGAFKQITIGGNSPDGLSDQQGPEVEVFMNSLDFVFGGITNPDPLLLVSLRDDNGINVVGNSIGHDLEAVLDEDTQNSLLLNDFFEAKLDDYTQGEVRYPISSLAEGLHKIRVKAWDIANNSSEGYTEFIVASSADIALKHVLNYPNPFTDRTCFQFEHSASNQQIDILLQVYTISGRLVKTIETSVLSDGALRQGDCIEWDGRDDFGDKLARGVYLYKIKVRANLPGGSALKGESKFEKLVLLK
ncbi:MAG TPA: type IX secretion system sortase PorU, partial [Haliscomenobacter sp.]|nr:type IX secretion system sortase PorU [Haliscomenobacter sp.]